MHESIKLFSEIVNSKWFLETPLILFLNKSDLLHQKIKDGVKLSDCFPDYTGDHDFDSYEKFITEKFTEVINNKDKTVFKHITCATDTSSVEVVWNAVQNIVLQKALDNAGLAM